MAAPTLLEIDSTQETLTVNSDSRDASAIQGRSIETGTPADQEVMTYQSSSGTWIYQTITENLDDRVAALLQSSSSGGLSWSYNDSAGTLTPVLALVNADIASGAAIAVSKLASSSVSYGGVSVTLGAADATPAFNLSDATAYPGDSSLVATGTIASGAWQGSTIGVAYGGTGATSLTDGGVLLGSGTGAVTATAVLGDGEILIGDGTTDPVALDVGSASAITILGTVATGVWEGTTVAVDQGGTGVTSSTGSGSVVLSTSPTLVTPALGTPASGTATNITGLPIVAGTTGTLTVARGGTGATSLTDGGVLFGSGTGAISASAVLGDGEILIGDASGDPATLDVGSSSAITILGTVATGTWNGSVIQATYGGSGLVGATDGTIAIADGSGAPTTLDVGSSTAITILGTVATGVWNGTSIGTGYTDAKVTSVVAGTLIDVSGTTGDVTVNTDLSELATSTSDGDGDFFAVVDAANAQKKLTKANIDISGFNDAVATSITGTGALNAGSITSGFGAINNGASDITTTGTVSATTLTGTLSTASQTNITTLGTITGGTWNAGAVTSSGDIVSGGNVKVPSGAARYIIQDTNATNTYSLTLQAGEGSAGYGGGLKMFGHSHASKPGWVTAGISSGSGGKFSVNTQGLAGGTDVFTVDANAVVDMGNIGTDNTNKGAQVLGRNWDSGEETEGWVMLNYHAADGINRLDLGGGHSAHNAATSITFNTASADDTRTGTQAMSIDGSQDVNIPNGGLAIGTTSSPETGLHISKTSSTGLGAQLTLDNPAAAAVGNAVEISFLTDTGADPQSTRNARILAECNNASNGAASLQFHTWDGSASAERMRIQQDGKVGINIDAVGTALLDPSSQMTVKGDVWSLTHSDGGFKVNNHTAGTTGGTLSFFKSRQGNYDPPSAAADDVVNGDTIFSIVGYGYSNSQFNESARMLAQVDGTFTSNQKPPGRFVFQTGISDGAMAEAMRIDSSQDVNIPNGGLAIGTTSSPAEQLHLYKDNTETNPQLKIEQDGTGDASLVFLLTGARNWSMGVDNSDSDKFKIAPQGDVADTTSMTIDTSGNVGIGTTAPAGILDVKDGDTVIAPNSSADNVVISQKSGDCGISILSGNSNCIIAFGDEASADDGAINYIHADRQMSFKAADTSMLWLSSDGFYLGSNVGDNQFRTSSAGGGSTTMYIGNQSITTSSDRRLKTNIVDSSLDAVHALNQLRVTDFNWDDPSDTSFNNRNARGVWTGMIAQEVVEHLPFTVNAPRDEEKVIDYDSDSTWSIEPMAMCGVLVKAIQELSTRIQDLEAQLDG